MPINNEPLIFNISAALTKKHLINNDPIETTNFNEHAFHKRSRLKMNPQTVCYYKDYHNFWWIYKYARN